MPMLWLALWLPDLPLAAFAARPLPAVVAERGRIVCADEVAAAAGIVPGMRSATARGLLPEIAVLARDAAREAALLEELACWAGRYTPQVSLAPPAALLLEIGAGLRLFGGAAPLIEALRRGCVERGLAPQLAAAPTPLAALWLARGGASPVVAAREALAAALGRLPVEVLEAPPPLAAALAAFGVRRLGELFALPRAGLARRLGSEFTGEIERALGERPHPLPAFAFPPRFELRLELPGPVTEAPALAFAAQRLIEALCGWLAARQAGVAAGALVLEHERSPRHAARSRIELRCASPTRDAQRLAGLLRERLAHTALAAPVQALSLVAEACEALPGASGDLFDAARRGGSADALERLVERLRARLGEEAVHGLAPVAEHRPECATRRAPLGTPVASSAPGPPRPLWLLAVPETLAEIGGRPHRRGALLELVAGPERIESGWWDGGERRADAWAATGETAAPGDVRRDYFVARTASHECFWIFRDREGWHLHGVFA